MPRYFASRFFFLSLLSATTIAFVSTQASAQESAAIPVKTIPSLDVPRYLGTWYEIAKFPNWFQKKCVSNTKAVYSLKDDGKLKVLNSCKTASGEVSEAQGTARQMGASDSPKLEVRFAPDWLSFLPLVWGDYWVIDLDSQYQVAAVSDPRREYLWVLSRTPQLDAAVYDALLKRLQEQQFDIRKLELTQQKM
ncbi:MAG: lipocalin [Polynucleobacter sp. 24-46-87]|jgi:apolipoprotein D and lipocalin family protein|nr:MAG: lipocalin [Polynucleobacter sp. 35-46-207]OYZ37416.1 MAG: lipocalin [Polynucleobacter sp. 16-46-70]OZA02512.1 MAG: lipocalin [Polynucleobacter sp. 24-46-87]OZA41842.1 MAG: lipocalin [Polynucleobacter sp. 17-46-58]OZB40300.1 MAG: lipocalin [Polynucleobacter sp. 39-45-136]HQR84910.1 lipocalin family protein [Polynucleobacter sp.]